MLDNRHRFRRVVTAAASALTMGLASMALGACDDPEPIPHQQAGNERPSPHAEETE